MLLFELLFPFSSDVYPAAELLDHTAVLLLVFGGLSIVSGYSHQQCTSTPFSLHPSTVSIICRLSDDSHFASHEVIFHCDFDLHFSDISDV